MKEELYSNSYPHPLSPAEEKECLLKMHEGDKAAKDKLIMHNMRLVAHIANKFFFSNEKEDLISIGFFGLLKGLETFKMDKNVKLSTYLSRCILNEILMYIRKLEKEKTCYSLDQPHTFHDDGDGPNLLSVLTQKHIDEFNDKVQKFNICDEVERLMQTLTDKEKQVISMHYGLNGYCAHSQREVSEILHWSRSYISRIEANALAKLKEELHYNEIRHDTAKTSLPT